MRGLAGTSKDCYSPWLLCPSGLWPQIVLAVAARAAKVTCCVTVVCRYLSVCCGDHFLKVNKILPSPTSLGQKSLLGPFWAGMLSLTTRDSHSHCAL